MAIEDTNIVSLRKQIDCLDDEIFALIAKRLDICREIGEIKQNESLPIFQTNRWKEMCEHRQFWAEQNNLSPESITAILKAIHDASVEIQQQKMMNPLKNC